MQRGYQYVGIEAIGPLALGAIFIYLAARKR